MENWIRLKTTLQERYLAVLEEPETDRNKGRQETYEDVLELMAQIELRADLRKG